MIKILMCIHNGKNQKKWTLFCALFLHVIFSTNQLSAQTDEPNKMKKWQLIGYAEDAARVGDYYASIDFYIEYLKRKPKDAKVMFKLAQLYYKTRNYKNAEITFAKTYELSPNKFFISLYYFAKVLKEQGMYGESLVQFKNFDKIAKKKGYKKIEKQSFKNEIDGIGIALIQNDSLKIVVDKLSDSINKSDIEFSPLIMNDSTFLYGSSNTDSILKVNFEPTTDNPFSYNYNKIHYRKFFTAKKKTNKWVRQNQEMLPFFNDTLSNTGSGCFSLDKTRFYFTKCNENWKYQMICNMYVTQQKNSNWEHPLMLDYTINNPDYTTSQPAIGSCYIDSLDVIYFISDRPGGMGGTDIWYTVYNPATKKYTKAVNAGVFINSQNDEKTPYFDMGAHALYFSSTGWPGIGGFDIFRSFGDLVNWSVPENIGAPINSSFDDLCYITGSGNETGFFTSNRTGSFFFKHENCCDDIYSFAKLKTENIPLSAKITLEDISNKFKNNIKCVKDTSEDISYLKGKTASLYLTEGTTEPIFIAKRQINKNGEFEFNLIKNKSYKITIEENNLMENSITLNTNNASITKIQLDSIMLLTIPETPIILKNLLYDFNVATLSDSAKQYLDTTLIKFLKEYTEISVEIYSHTDSKGGDQYNKTLSQKRADNVVKYLSENGVAEDRLNAIGEGATLPIIKNTNDDGTDNPEGRKQNRRTEFKILKEKTMKMQ